MSKTFKKWLSVILIAITAIFILAACGNKIPDDSDTITLEKLEALVFNDATFEYDGEVKSIYVENIYEEQGVTVSYRNNSNTKPGSYTVTATIKYDALSVTKKAKITITKASSILEAESMQTVYLTDKEFAIAYKLNNDKQEVLIVNKEGKKVNISALTKEGVYELELYAAENEYFAESNHVKVTFNVIKSQFDIRFDSKEVEANGNEQK